MCQNNNIKKESLLSRLLPHLYTHRTSLLVSQSTGMCKEGRRKWALKPRHFLQGKHIFPTQTPTSCFPLVPPSLPLSFFLPGSARSMQGVCRFLACKHWAFLNIPRQLLSSVFFDLSLGLLQQLHLPAALPQLLALLSFQMLLPFLTFLFPLLVSRTDSIPCVSQSFFIPQPFKIVMSTDVPYGEMFPSCQCPYTFWSHGCCGPERGQVPASHAGREQPSCSLFYLDSTQAPIKAYLFLSEDANVDCQPQLHSRTLFFTYSSCSYSPRVFPKLAPRGTASVQPTSP